MNATPTDALIAQLAYLVGAGGPLNALKLGLYTNNYDPSLVTALSDLVELTTGDFPGYAQIAFTWGAAYTDLSGLANVAGSRCEFKPNAPVTLPGITVYGAFAVDAATSLVLQFAYKFPTPYNITSELQAIVQYPSYQLAGPG